VEILFAHTYLILFGKLAVGGLLALAVPPFFDVERGFYKSTAAVYLALGYLMFAGRSVSAGTLPCSTRRNARGADFVGNFRFAVQCLCADTLCGKASYPRTRVSSRPFSAASSHLPSPVGPMCPRTSPSRRDSVCSRSLDGSGRRGRRRDRHVARSLYLIETGLDLLPLRRMLAFCKICVRAEIAAVSIAGGHSVAVAVEPVARSVRRGLR
jgi:hypothetical protein